MANFDDLIPKTTLDNPFDNPFTSIGGGRPRSPDPWSLGASYYEQQHAPVHESSADAFADSYSAGNYASQEHYAPQERHDDEPVTHHEEVSLPTAHAVEQHFDPLAPSQDEEEIPQGRPHPFKPLAVVRAITPPPREPAPAPAKAEPTVKPEEAHKEPPVPAAAAPESTPPPAEETKPAEETVSLSPAPTIAPPAEEREHDAPPPATSEPSSAFSPTEDTTSGRSPYTSGYSTPIPDSAPSLPPLATPSTSETPTPQPQPKAHYESVPSPLTSPRNTGGFTSIDRSFNGLALGGEMPGWGGPVASPLSPGPPSARGYRAAPDVVDDDDEDDRPLGVTRNLVSQPAPVAQEEVATSQLLSSSTSAGPETPLFVITVGDPQKVGDPIKAHIVYTVSTRTLLPEFKKPSFSVLRRYSDFLWLFDALASNNPGIVIPPVPEKSPFGRFAETFVEARRLALNKFLQKTASHPKLAKDPDLRLFLESDSFTLDIKHRIPKEGGPSGLIATIGTSITGPKFYETDEWFDKKKAYLEALESQLRSLVKAIEAVAKQRVDVITSITEFTDAVAILGSSDLSKQLSNSLSVMADVERKGKELLEEQSKHDMETILGTVEEYLRLIQSVRLSFASRIKLFYTWKAAEAEKLRVRNMHEKTLRQRGLDRQSMIPLQREIEQAELKAQDARTEYDDVTKLIKLEVARFEHERVTDFKASLEAFLEGMISRQTEMIEAWEQYQQLLLKRAAQNPQSGTPVAS